jgi:hypothetical protein
MMIPGLMVLMRAPRLDAAVRFARHLIIDAHGADEDQPLQAGGSHGVDDGPRLGCHIARQIGVDDILILHGVAQSGPVEHIAIDDFHPVRSRVLQPAGPPQIERQRRGRIVKQDPCRVARKLSVSAEDQDPRHAQRPTRACK